MFSPMIIFLSTMTFFIIQCSGEFVPPSQRILQYLHRRGEALDLQTPSPVKATYIDWQDVNWNKPQQNILDIVNGGYNVVIMAFFLSSGNPTDMAQAWASVDTATKNATIAYAHSKGAVVMVSLGGSTDSPFDVSASVLGRQVSEWAMTNFIDGVDFDLENLQPGFKTFSQTADQVIQWMIDIAAVTKQLMGSNALVSHAPQAPYFSKIGGGGNPWPGPSGGYTAVWKGGHIDWFNCQFYNQGPTCYTTFTSLFTQSNVQNDCPNFPNTSVAEIAAYGVPYAAIVVGKPLDTSDAGSGWVSASDLHTFVGQGKQMYGWSAGVMNWAWSTAGGPLWIHTVYP